MCGIVASTVDVEDTQKRIAFVLKVLLHKCKAPPPSSTASRPPQEDMFKRLSELEMTDELKTEPQKFVNALKIVLNSFLDHHSQVISLAISSFWRRPTRALGMKAPPFLLPPTLRQDDASYKEFARELRKEIKILRTFHLPLPAPRVNGGGNAQECIATQNLIHPKKSETLSSERHRVDFNGAKPPLPFSQSILKLSSMPSSKGDTVHTSQHLAGSP